MVAVVTRRNVWFSPPSEGGGRLCVELSGRVTLAYWGRRAQMSTSAVGQTAVRTGNSRPNKMDDRNHLRSRRRTPSRWHQRPVLDSSFFSLSFLNLLLYRSRSSSLSLHRRCKRPIGDGWQRETKVRPAGNQIAEAAAVTVAPRAGTSRTKLEVQPTMNA